MTKMKNQLCQVEEAGSGEGLKAITIRFRLLFRGKQLLASVVFLCAIIGALPASGQAITADINVRLQPVVEHIDLVTDINIVGGTMFICTQPGVLYRKNLTANTSVEVFLDLRDKVGRLGSHIPGLPGLGYPNPESYDERASRVRCRSPVRQQWLILGVVLGH